MTKRLQVLLEEAELEEIRKTARRHRMSVAEWVRQSLRAARQAEPRIAVRSKLQAIRAAVEQEFPAGDIDQMLDEVERGYTGSGPE